MFKFIYQSMIALLLLSYSVGEVQGQIHIGLTVSTDLSYEDGAFLGVGIGLRKGQLEFRPAVLFGEGMGGKLEIRWYQKLVEGKRLRPYLTLQQVAFRRINACVDNACPFLFYQVLPGAGMAWQIRKRYQLSISMATGIKKQEQNPWETDFILGIGGRYEF